MEFTQQSVQMRLPLVLSCVEPAPRQPLAKYEVLDGEVC